MDETDELQELQVTQVWGSSSSINEQLLPQLISPAVHHGTFQYLPHFLLSFLGLLLDHCFHGFLVLRVIAHIVH